MPPDPDRARDARDQPGVEADAAGSVGLPSLASLPIAGLTRGRLMAIAAVLAASWIAVAFARQVGAAGDLTARADGLRVDNERLERQVAALRDELVLVNRAEYIGHQARAFRLGDSAEIPFTLAADAPPLPADAPGSAAVRLGATGASRSPLEGWFSVFFGPAG